MTRPALIEALRGLGNGGIVRFRLEDVPLDEVLLTLHVSRFTGSVSVGDHPPDYAYLREGAVVGVRPNVHLAAQLLGQVLVQQKALRQDDLDRVLNEGGANGLLLGERLLGRGLITAEDLDRACAEQGRRRIFHLYDHADAPVVVCEGLHRLSNFHPTYVDLRPAIAFGMVVRANAERKREVIEKVRNRRARLAVPYDEQRNSYGLPPAVLYGVRELSNGGIAFSHDPALPGLGRDETAGVLLLFDRMSLLEIE